MSFEFPHITDQCDDTCIKYILIEQTPKKRYICKSNYSKIQNNTFKTPKNSPLRSLQLIRPIMEEIDMTTPKKFIDFSIDESIDFSIDPSMENTINKRRRLNNMF